MKEVLSWEKCTEKGFFTGLTDVRIRVTFTGVRNMGRVSTAGRMVWFMRGPGWRER